MPMQPMLTSFCNSVQWGPLTHENRL